DLARRSSFSELDIAEYVIDQIQTSNKEQEPNQTNRANETIGSVAARAADPGYHLIAEGRSSLEQHIGFRPPFSLRIDRLQRAMGLNGYIGSILLIAVGLRSEERRVGKDGLFTSARRH